MAVAGPEANVNQLVKSYLQSQRIVSNSYSYQRARLTFQNVEWFDRTPVSGADEYRGITRSIAVEDRTNSQGSVSVTVNPAAVSVRIHLIAGRFVGGSKKVELQLPETSAFLNFGAVEFDASKDKSDATQRSVPVTVVQEALNSFRRVNVTSSTSIFEGNFRCTAILQGDVIVDGAQIPISAIVRHFGYNLPAPFSRFGDALSWPVGGMAEFTLDSQTLVH